MIRFSEEDETRATFVSSPADDRKLTFDNNMRSRKGCVGVLYFGWTGV